MTGKGRDAVTRPKLRFPNVYQVPGMIDLKHSRMWVRWFGLSMQFFLLRSCGKALAVADCLGVGVGVVALF